MRISPVLLFAIPFLLFISSCDDENFCEFGNPSVEQVQLAADIELIDQYLTDNNLTAEVHPSGIRYIIESSGTGRQADACSIVRISYRGTYLDGEVFDETGEDNNGNPITLDYPLANFITGWHIGIPLIKPTGRIVLYIPSGYAYGPNGFLDIPSNAILVFEIDLVSVYN